uniref:NADH dehydrogenase subunit 4 n=1 Tax=Spirostomum yagiui TaxID=1471042 RepID=UPI0030018059|nr:NADH dehydrogenase subunit 4 [Spirostomum yagiui]
MNNNIFFIIKELILFGRLLIIFSFILTLLFFFLLLFQKFNILNSYYNTQNYKYIYVWLTVLISLVYMFIGFKIFFLCYNNPYYTFIDSKLTLMNLINGNVVFELFKSIDFFLFPFRRFFIFSISKLNIIFLLLFICLYPIISFMVISDDNIYSFKYYIHMQLIFCFSFFLLLTENIAVFYFVYEVIIILTYSMLNLSSNSRGNIEASLYFLGWATLGSILVGFGFLWYIICTNSFNFLNMSISKLTHFETNLIYLLLFLGFGTKMSLWPFWYWLPKAHVEVSTGVSIFLSCIIIKLSYFCMLKFQYFLPGEIIVSFCIFLGVLGVIDIIFHVINIRDLKSLIAHSSVLHTNLLIILTHTDTIHTSLNNILLYVWGHSLSTAGLFLCVYLIELRFGTRNIIHISGIWYSMPLLGYLIVWNLLSFLEFPITLFFWGELWLWLNLISYFPILGMELLFFCSCIFLSIFFKFWWGILFGVSTTTTLPINNPAWKWFIIWIVWILILQLVVGLQPSYLTSVIGIL